MKFFHKKDNKKREEIFSILKKIYVDVTAKDAGSINPKCKIDAVGLTSLGKIQLICIIEYELNIEIPNTALRKFKTFDDIIDFIEQQRKKTEE